MVEDWFLIGGIESSVECIHSGGDDDEVYGGKL